MKKFPNEEAGKRLKEFIDNFWFGSKSDFARALNLKHPSQIADYIKGKSLLGSERLSILSELGMNIKYYLFGEGDILNKKGMMVKETGSKYGINYDKLIDILTEENKNLKAENYDLRKQLEQLQERLNKYES